jgi:hypothetical protein
LAGIDDQQLNGFLAGAIDDELVWLMNNLILEDVKVPIV